KLLRGKPVAGDAGAGSTTTTSGSASASRPGSEQLSALSAHLSYGSTWGSKPEAEKMAKGVVEVLVDEFSYAKKSELGVAVEIIPGSPRKIVALVQMKYLKEESNADRKKLLTMIRNGIGESGSFASEPFYIGVKGALLWGAIGT